MSNSEPLSAETIRNFLYASTATVSMQMLKRYTHLRAEDLVAKLDKIDRAAA